MNAPTTSPTIDTLASLDECPACECPCHVQRGEATPKADLRIKIHAGRPGGLHPCDDIAILLCEHCFEVIRTQTEHALSMSFLGRIHCGCGRKIRQLSDIILAVIRL